MTVLTPDGNTIELALGRWVGTNGAGAPVVAPVVVSGGDVGTGTPSIRPTPPPPLPVLLTLVTLDTLVRNGGAPRAVDITFGSKRIGGVCGSGVGGSVPDAEEAVPPLAFSPTAEPVSPSGRRADSPDL